MAQYVDNYGTVLRTLLNGVKHTAPSFANLHGLDASELEATIRGEKPLTTEVLDAINAHPPLNVRSLIAVDQRGGFPIADDTDNGVIVFSADQRVGTERTFNRGPDKVPFYIYADTAMSRTSPFRPEWIKELYLHDGKNPETPDWAFNKGHFEYQITFFIGHVNFHWIDKAGTKHVRQMQTGDVNYITPFVPHTFTTRKKDDGLILAVTYGGSVATEGFQSAIHSMPLEDFMDSYTNQVSKVEIENDLSTDKLKGVIVRKDSRNVPHDGYLESILLEDVPFQPHTRAVHYELSQDSETNNALTDAERWGYNYGDVPLLLKWNGQEREIQPGSSFFIRPDVGHSVANLGNGQGKLIVMEIKPEAGNPVKDLALIHRYSGNEGLSRVHSETKQWF